MFDVGDCADLTLHSVSFPSVPCRCAFVKQDRKVLAAGEMVVTNLYLLAVHDKELRKQLVAEMNFLKPQLRGA